MNIYEPHPRDVVAWAEAPDSSWPAADWDFYVMNGRNDDLVLSLADSYSCRKRDFFVHCLYYLVGDHLNSANQSKERRTRIDRLLSLVQETSSAEVKEWRDRATRVLTGVDPFQPFEWLHHIVSRVPTHQDQDGLLIEGEE